MAQIKGSITVFPARAGVIPPTYYLMDTDEGLSRTSGGDPMKRKYIIHYMWSFPHERG